jgi:hypothetical protein
MELIHEQEGILRECTSISKWLIVKKMLMVNLMKLAQ